MFCSWETSDKIAAIGIAINFFIFIALVYHAIKFRSQADTLKGQAKTLNVQAGILKETVEHMRNEASRREKFDTAKMRAYINVDLSEDFFHLRTDQQLNDSLMRMKWGGDDNVRWMHFDISITNMGETPARDVTHSTDIIIHKQGENIPHVAELPHEEPFDIGSRESVQKGGKLVKFPTKTVNELMSSPHTACFLFYGIVRYKDFIGNPCYTRFAYEIHFPVTGPPDGYKTPTHNEKEPFESS